MGFFDKLAKLVNPVSLITDTIGGITGLISSNQATKNANHLADKQIAAQQAANEYNVQAQKEINEANIASQEKINQQQLDFANNINDLMRRDSKNAISDKRADLMRSGYSTADPNLSGFSAASLSSPSLSSATGIAPQVSPEFTPQMASTLIQSRSSAIDNVAKIFDTYAKFNLARAQASKTDKDTELLSAQFDTLVTTSVQELNNLIAQHNLTNQQAKVAMATYTNLGQEFKRLKALTEQEEFKASKADEQFTLYASEVGAKLASWDAQTSLTKIQQDVEELNKRYQKVVTDFAEKGLDFKAGDIFSSLLKLLLSPDAKKVVPLVIENIKSIISSGFEALKVF